MRCVTPQKFGKQQAYNERQNILNYNGERSGRNISKTSLEKGSWNKKNPRKYWAENKHLAVKFGSVKLLLRFSFFEREKDVFFLHKNNYQILISNTTAFFTWRIFILSRIRVKIKLLLLFWRWVLCKAPLSYRNNGRKHKHYLLTFI